ncbi:uncharacterized protein LOC127565743 [Drosophila albomicans]|uniref:Uncharacterized protein LOC127565743 n=1 Tax=Drosophila albomicans TaxID=7291 RepID=A0A9C6T8H8_DROAB|nr:uncharacterized protein LOC127565743 [Drosophila albomicans]
MLKSSGFTAFYQDAPNQCLFEVKTKDPRLNLGLVSFIPTFELESDLNSNYATSTNEFEMDFSLPSHRFNDFAAPASKLNVLPEKLDFSELLSFQSETSSYPREPSIKEFCPPVDVMQMESQLIPIPEEQLKTDESSEILAIDVNETQPVLASKLGIFSEFLKSNSHSLVVDVKHNGVKLRPQDAIKRNVSTDYLMMIKKEMQEDLPEAAIQTSILASYYNTKDKNTLPPATFNACQYASIKNESEEAKNSTLKENSLSASVKKTCSSTIPMEKLECNKKIAKKNTRNIVGAIEIQETGVQIFRKPTKLFTFENLRDWKKKGEGQIEIWKLQQSDDEIYYMLLWDKCTQKLLIHMRLDSKWSIDYLTNSTNSCRWSHYNYAQGPEGVRERFACRFRDSNVAAQFIDIVGKCTANSNLH